MKVSTTLQQLGVPYEALSPILLASTAAEAKRVWVEGLAHLKSYYRQAVRRVHPDVPGGSAESFQLVQRAWECLQSEEFVLTVWEAHQEAVERLRPKGLTVTVATGPGGFTIVSISSTLGK